MQGLSFPPNKNSNSKNQIEGFVGGGLRPKNNTFIIPKQMEKNLARVLFS